MYRGGGIVDPFVSYTAIQRRILRHDDVEVWFFTSLIRMPVVKKIEDLRHKWEVVFRFAMSPLPRVAQFS